MRRCLVATILALGFCSTAAFAQHVPIFTQGQVELQSRAQLIANTGSWDVLAELLGRLQDTTAPLQSYESVTLGGYYRVVPNLKIGALARLQAGARHDDDVIANLVTNQWDWADTSGRLEPVLMLDASPRFQLGFLPTGSWVFMLKNRYEYDTWNGQMSVTSRPELTWFWIRGREPLLNLSLSYELYFPLNYGTALIYQSYPYLTALWHATSEVGVELAAAYESTIWSTSTSWGPQGADWSPYSTLVTAWVFSIGVVYTPKF